MYKGQSLCALLHDFQTLGNGEFGVCLAAHFFDFHAGGEFSQGELAGGSVDLEHTLRAY
jgi:hypothetical protein